MIKKSLAVAALALAISTPAKAYDWLAPYPSGFRTIDGNQLNKMVNIVNGITGNGTAGTLTASIFYAGNGTVSLPSFTFTSDTNTGLYRIGTDNIGVSAAGAKVLDIATTGLSITGVNTITSASATALSVGRLGATTPALLVDASTATSITGIKIKSAGTGAGVAISAIGEASNGALTIDAQGSGTISLGATSTGNIVLTRATTGLSYSGTGTITARSATATPAAASAVAAMCFGSDSICIYWGTGAPSATAAKGSLYIQTDGSSSSTRMFINNGTTNWVAVTTAS